MQEPHVPSWSTVGVREGQGVVGRTESPESHGEDVGCGSRQSETVEREARGDGGGKRWG